MQDSHILDYNFAPGDRAQYVYIDAEGEEQTVMVKILDYKDLGHENFYIISAHEKTLEEVGISVNAYLSKHYQTDLPLGHKAAHLDPDELLPHFRQLHVIVDNTRGNSND